MDPYASPRSVMGLHATFELFQPAGECPVNHLGSGADVSCKPGVPAKCALRSYDTRCSLLAAGFQQVGHLPSGDAVDFPRLSQLASALAR